MQSFFDTRPSPKNHLRAGHLSPAQELVASVGGILFMLVALFFSPLFFIIESRNRNQLRDRFRKNGRLIPRHALERGQYNHGILLIEATPVQLLTGQIWWLDEKYFPPSPCPLPTLPADKASLVETLLSTLKEAHQKQNWQTSHLVPLAKHAQLVDIQTRRLRTLNNMRFARVFLIDRATAQCFSQSRDPENEPHSPRQPPHGFKPNPNVP
jgi:hypothetical protein